MPYRRPLEVLSYNYIMSEETQENKPLGSIFVDPITLTLAISNGFDISIAQAAGVIALALSVSSVSHTQISSVNSYAIVLEHSISEADINKFQETMREHYQQLVVEAFHQEGL